MRKKTRGFTIVEILTVLAIISLLIAILLPSLNMARNAARTAKQKVQMSYIDQALLAWRNDFGDYPPSSCIAPPYPDNYYCGAQKLAEALLGWDLLGFHPSSVFTVDGTNPALAVPNIYNPTIATEMAKRKPRYLELETANAFRLNQVFRLQGTLTPAAYQRYVICDSFGRTDVTVGKENVKVGRPILYYRADTSQKQFVPLPGKTIYDFTDNLQLIITAQINDIADNPNINHPLRTPANFYSNQYKILDTKIYQSAGLAWPRRPDSYILISAGLDGLYGTQDDITNFGQ